MQGSLLHFPSSAHDPLSMLLACPLPRGPSGDATGHFHQNFGVQGVQLEASQKRPDWGWIQGPPLAPTHQPRLPPPGDLMKVGSVLLAVSHGFVRINISKSPWHRVLIRPSLLRHAWYRVHLNPGEQADRRAVGRGLPVDLPLRVYQGGIRAGGCWARRGEGADFRGSLAGPGAGHLAGIPCPSPTWHHCPHQV